MLLYAGVCGMPARWAVCACIAVERAAAIAPDVAIASGHTVHRQLERSGESLLAVLTHIPSGFAVS
jgi:hypothetical protein